MKTSQIPSPLYIVGDEILVRRITSDDEWHTLVDEAESDDQDDTTPHRCICMRLTIVVRPRH
jgi:hypothetical protein